MANPQKENGFTPIANEIMEALAGIRISGEARQCLDVILRKTYGWNKKSDIISLSQFSLLTKMPKSTVCRSLIKLRQMAIIIDKNDNGRAKKYMFNKDFTTWKPLSKKIIIDKNDNGHYQKSKKVLTIMGNTKESIKNNILQKQGDPAYFSNPDIKEIYFYGTNKGFSTIKEQSQCWAIGRLLKRISKENLIKIIDLSFEVQGEQYAPQIKNFLDLDEKYINLAGWVKRQQSPKRRIIK